LSFQPRTTVISRGRRSSIAPTQRPVNDDDDDEETGTKMDLEELVCLFFLVNYINLFLFQPTKSGVHEAAVKKEKEKKKKGLFIFVILCFLANFRVNAFSFLKCSSTFHSKIEINFILNKFKLILFILTDTSALIASAIAKVDADIEYCEAYAERLQVEVNGWTEKLMECTKQGVP
jgi:hypothetical protein